MSIAINDNPTYAQYVATAAQTTFIVSFPFAENTDLNVYLRDPAADPDDATDLVSAANYTVTGAGTATGGTIILNTGATAGFIVTIVGNMPTDRTTVFPELNNITITLNEQLNDLTLMVKQLETNQSTTIPHYNNSAIIVDGNKILPVLAENELWIGGVNDITTVSISGMPAPLDGNYFVGTNNDNLTNEFNFGALTTGLLKHTVAGGVSTPATAISGTDFYAPGDVVAIADGGTGATTAIDALDNLISGTTIPSVTAASADKILIQDNSDADTFKTVTAQSIANLSGGLQWTVITADTTVVMNQGYIVNAATRVVVSLPATFAAGDELRVVGLGAGGWALAPVLTQQIYFGTSTTLAGNAGGRLESTEQRDCVEIVGVVPNSELTVTSAVGNITVV